MGDQLNWELVCDLSHEESEYSNIPIQNLKEKIHS